MGARLRPHSHVTMGLDSAASRKSAKSRAMSSTSLVRALLAFSLLVLSACTQGEGDTCRRDEECSSGLMCCKATSATQRGTCEATCSETDAGQTDAGELDAAMSMDDAATETDGGDPGPLDAAMSIDASTPIEDAGSETDAATDAGADTDAATDAGTETDAATDAATDASSETDAGAETDAG